MIAILASGPSLDRADIDLLNGKATVIAVNDSYRLCPWADILYAADHRWWHHHNYCRDFIGERWSQHIGPRDWVDTCRKEGINVIQCKRGNDISLDSSFVYDGKNSTFQALNMAVLMGEKEILILGLDCRVTEKTHWFGDHPPKLQKKSPYPIFRRAFVDVAEKLERLGVRVINCSPISTVDCFERMNCAQAISELTTK